MEVNTAICHVLDLIHELEWVSEDLVAPDLMECEPELTSDECSQTVEFLRRMACAVSEGDMLSVDPVVGRLLSTE